MVCRHRHVLPLPLTQPPPLPPRAKKNKTPQVSWDDESARRLGVLRAPSSPAFLFRAESPANGVQTAAASPPAGVLAAVLHAGSTLDVSVKLDGTVSVPVGRW